MANVKKLNVNNIDYDIVDAGAGKSLQLQQVQSQGGIDNVISLLDGSGSSLSSISIAAGGAHVYEIRQQTTGEFSELPTSVAQNDIILCYPIYRQNDRGIRIAGSGTAATITIGTTVHNITCDILSQVAQYPKDFYICVPFIARYGNPSTPELTVISLLDTHYYSDGLDVGFWESGNDWGYKPLLAPYYIYEKYTTNITNYVSYTAGGVAMSPTSAELIETPSYKAVIFNAANTSTAPLDTTITVAGGYNYNTEWGIPKYVMQGPTYNKNYVLGEITAITKSGNNYTCTVNWYYNGRSSSEYAGNLTIFFKPIRN